VKLLIAYDGTPSADGAIEDLRRAGLPREGVALVLCVADGRSHVSGIDQADSLAQSASNRIRSYFPRWEIFPNASSGSAHEVILRTSDWWRPDLLITGRSGGHEPARTIVGNASLELVHQARCSVRVATGSAAPNEGPIRLIVGNDGSAGAHSAILSVANRLWPQDTEVRLLSIGTAAERKALQASKVGGSPLRGAGLKVDEIFLLGDPRQDIVREAKLWSSDAIFLGARGLSAIDRFLAGSVSTAVATRASCAVEVVR
jgi:nucleotide-binding universal stress UspA family protein